MISAKEIIVSTAQEMGFQRAVVASMEPMIAERKFFEQWLGNGYAASMQYLQRNPEKRSSPKLLCPEAYSAVLLFASYYTESPADPGPEFGRVARYAVGRDYHEIIPAKLAELKARVQTRLDRPILGKFFSDDVELYEQAYAARSGLGFPGKNTMIIGPKLMGSYHFVAEFFTDLPLEPDEPYQGTCGNCFRCASACPTGAIVAEGELDSRLCISFLTIENKVGIPLELREKVGEWVFGCDICQEVCPYNQKPPLASWEEFQPASGVGHFLNLFDILKIADKKSFLEFVGKTALTRPKRFGLVRNALVVLGNRLAPRGASAIADFIELETNRNLNDLEANRNVESTKILLEHAFWALSRYPDSKKTIDGIYEQASWSKQRIYAQFMDLN